MLDVQWVDEQIERVRNGTATMQVARDYALLCIAREHLAGGSKAANASRPPDNPPTLEAVEKALSEINITTRDDRRKAQELREAARIMGEE